MSTKTATACLYPAICTMAALSICPVALAGPDRQCYQKPAGEIVCIDLSGSGSEHRDCYLVPIGPRCFNPTAHPGFDGRVQLPNGEWALPLPRERWPSAGPETRAPTAPPDNDKPASTPDRRPPAGTPQVPGRDPVARR